jgi:hypothetical protein
LTQNQWLKAFNPSKIVANMLGSGGGNRCGPKKPVMPARSALLPGRAAVTEFFDPIFLPICARQVVYHSNEGRQICGATAICNWNLHHQCVVARRQFQFPAEAEIGASSFTALVPRQDF